MFCVFVLQIPGQAGDDGHTAAGDVCHVIAGDDSHIVAGDVCHVIAWYVKDVIAGLTGNLSSKDKRF